MELSRYIEDHLSRDEEDYELEVGSAGLGQPFKVPQQYHCFVGKDVEVLNADGQKYKGVLKSAEGNDFVVTVLEKQKVEGKKRPQIIVLVGMPVVGIVLFYFFGQNIRKERYIERNSYERLTHEMLKDHEKDAHLTGGKYQRLMEFIERDHRTILTSANTTQLVETGREWIQSLLRDFQQAQHHIHLLYGAASDLHGNLNPVISHTDNLHRLLYFF